MLIDATHRLGKGNTRVTKGILSHKTKKKIGMLNTFKQKKEEMQATFVKVDEKMSPCTCKLSSGKEVSGMVDENPSMSTKSLSVDP